MLVIIIVFSVTGKRVHPERSTNQINFRRLNLEERDAAKHELLNIDPSKYRNKLFQDADLGTLKMGNCNVPKTIGV